MTLKFQTFSFSNLIGFCWSPQGLLSSPTSGGRLPALHTRFSSLHHSGFLCIKICAYKICQVFPVFFLVQSKALVPHDALICICWQKMLIWKVTVSESQHLSLRYWLNISHLLFNTQIKSASLCPKCLQVCLETDLKPSAVSLTVLEVLLVQMSLSLETSEPGRTLHYLSNPYEQNVSVQKSSSRDLSCHMTRANTEWWDGFWIWLLYPAAKFQI